MEELVQYLGTQLTVLNQTMVAIQQDIGSVKTDIKNQKLLIRDNTKNDKEQGEAIDNLSSRIDVLENQVLEFVKTIKLMLSQKNIIIENNFESKGNMTAKQNIQNDEK